MGWPDDSMAAFFLVCFFVGILFTVASFLLGLGHDSNVAIDGHGGHVPDLAHAGQSTAGHGSGDGAPQSVAAHGGPPLINVSTIVAFLTWFGGAGYILRVYSGVGAAAALVLAGIVGVGGAALVFLFLSKILYNSQHVLDPNDFRLPGTLARTTGPIRAGGTGEIVFIKGDTRQVSGARSVDGRAIDRGEEVVIMRYARGIAYVQAWDELMSPGDEIETSGASIDGADGRSS